MHVVTFFDEVNVNKDSLKIHQEIISLWKYSWEYNGYKALVFTSKDIEKNQKYYDFLMDVYRINNFVKKSIHTNIDQSNVYRAYNPLSPPSLIKNYLKWLVCSQSFSNKNQYLYCDYSIINIKFGTKNPSLKHDLNYIKFLNGKNTNLFSFNSKTATKITQSLFKIAKKYQNKLVKDDRRQVLDNNVLNLIPSTKKSLNFYKIIYSNECCRYFSMEDESAPPLYEFAFLNLKNMILNNSKFNHYDPITLSRDLIKQVLVNEKIM